MSLQAFNCPKHLRPFALHLREGCLGEEDPSPGLWGQAHLSTHCPTGPTTPSLPVQDPPGCWTQTVSCGHNVRPEPTIRGRGRGGAWQLCCHKMALPAPLWLLRGVGGPSQPRAVLPADACLEHPDSREGPTLTIITAPMGPAKLQISVSCRDSQQKSGFP